MKLSYLGRLTGVTLSLLCLCLPVSAEVETGSTAPAFTLTSIRGSQSSLADHAGKTVILEWTNYDCPFVKKHYSSGNMQALQAEASAAGAVWLSINSSAPGKQGHYAPEEWARKAEEQSVAAADILLDTDGSVGRSYGAKTTPHIFIIDASGKVVYQGAIDDKPTADAADIPAAKNYVRQALAELAAGRPISEGSTKAYGCSVKY